jgi:hypothetical protein
MLSSLKKKNFNKKYQILMKLVIISLKKGNQILLREIARKADQDDMKYKKTRRLS